MNKNYIIHYKHIKRDQPGISILLSILLLSSLTILTIVVSDIVLRVAKTSREIGESEVAYYAAETAIEKTLYEIEKNRNVSGLDGTGGSLASGANWTRQVSGITLYSVKCSDLGGQEGICVNQVGDISGGIFSANPLYIKLDPGSSFQLDLNFTGISDITPNMALLVLVDFVTGQDEGKVIDYNYTLEQSSVRNNDFLFAATELHTFRFINNQASQVEFRILPLSIWKKVLPIGIQVTGTGDYQGEQRILEVERKNWQIY